MKRIFILFALLILGQNVFAFDIVYPKRFEVTINSPKTFFIGASDKPLTVNGQNVELHRTGAFAYVVELSEGVNKFEIKSEDETKTYLITRPKASTAKYEPPKFNEFSAQKSFVVTSDKSPLRSTPVDAGVNRISHLQKDVLLKVDGAKGGFYRVALGDERYAWINKNNVKETEDFDLATVNSYDKEENDEFVTYIFHVDKKIPYEVVEGETLKLNFFNTKEKYYFEYPYKETFPDPKLAGYSANYEGGDLIFKIRKFPTVNQKHPLKGINITVDAGHGGKEIGATGCLGDKEKDINLKIAKDLEQELISRGANVTMTRQGDDYVSLNDRVKIANDSNSMIFISVHGNALPDRLNPNLHRGTSVFYYYNESKLLGANVLTSVLKNTGMENDKLRQESFAVVRNTNVLSVLIEVGYLINPDDNEMLIDKHFQKQCAKAIAEGVENYFK